MELFEAPFFSDLYYDAAHVRASVSWHILYLYLFTTNYKHHVFLLQFRETGRCYLDKM